MERQTTANLNTIPYQRASANVDFLDSIRPRPDLPPFRVRFRFEPDGKFDSSLHFHAKHSEYLYCEKGRIRVTLGTQEPRFYDSRDGMIEILPGVAHRWEVIPLDNDFKNEGDISGSGDEGTIVWEHSDPEPELKELFFRNIFGLINDHNGNPPLLQMIKIFSDYDNYPIGHQGWMQSTLSTPVRLMINGLGWGAKWSGYKSVYKEYTPQYLDETAKRYGLN